jgi:hypothetical protein
MQCVAEPKDHDGYQGTLERLLRDLRVDAGRGAMPPWRTWRVRRGRLAAYEPMKQFIDGPANGRNRPLSDAWPSTV